MPYVNIGVVGLSRGTVSTAKGAYHMDLSGVGDEHIVRFSSVEYQNVEWKIGELKAKQRDSFHVVLKKAIMQMQEVVIRSSHELPLYLGAERPEDWPGSGVKPHQWCRNRHTI